MADQETERSFLIADMPDDLHQHPSIEISQGYIAIEPNGAEVRVREEDGQLLETIKSSGDITRQEVPISLTKDQFLKLWPTTVGRRIIKTRTKIPLGKLTAEVDLYHGSNTGHSKVEVEFADEEQVAQFQAPPWFGREVTYDKRYKNRSIAVYGFPDDGIPVTELDDGVQKVIDVIEYAEKKNSKPWTVLVGGGSASGKTSQVAARIAQRFGATSLTMDDAYRGKRFMDVQAQAGNILNWDHPQMVDIDLVKSWVEAHSLGEAFEKPVYSFKTGEPEGTEVIEPNKGLVIDGLFALKPSVAAVADIKVFVDIGMHGRILRRLMRDVQRTGQTPADILRYFSEIVEPMHEAYVLSTRQNAGIVIKNEYQPHIEALRSEMHEFQLKLRAEIESETLRRLGAERLGSSFQEDTYYTPLDRDLSKTGEMVRIRQESGETVLTYKGPASESVFRKRPKLEFPIDLTTANFFIARYGDKYLQILKKRTLFSLNGLLFSLDRDVTKVTPEKEEQLGGFLEIRANSDEDHSKAIELIEALGLSPADCIKKAYSEF